MDRSTNGKTPSHCIPLNSNHITCNSSAGKLQLSSQTVQEGVANDPSHVLRPKNKRKGENLQGT
ncbi:Hypothetical predicted protein [Pelobates cultripes]|uniref:Uncharacterized protein n=1 Tax=Pelobates cultripes TaxID=61616 RepID=A0AAD1S6Y6_PELCU|nr:Hypothetical predicted protein [Pelobates cultripes]